MLLIYVLLNLGGVSISVAFSFSFLVVASLSADFALFFFCFFSFFPLGSLDKRESSRVRRPCQMTRIGLLKSWNQATQELMPIAVLNVNYDSNGLQPNLNLGVVEEFDDQFTRRFFFFDAVSG